MQSYVTDLHINNVAAAKSWPLYLPSNQNAEIALKPREGNAAAVVRALSHSLVVVEVASDKLVDFLMEPGIDTRDLEDPPAVAARWRVGADAELFPPLFLGYFRDAWYGLLRTKKREQLRRVASLYDWAATVIAPVFLQRMLCARYAAPDMLCDEYIIEFVDHMLSHLSPATFFSPGAAAGIDATGSITSFEWVTRAIACSNSQLARQRAKDFDKMC
ncbi:hypothetical protein LTR36_002810 [Oleoguttula mirabilis]|uniref:Uncharacterized protein n=1 Tax=Oleoguttula mirabilis TaxID=1507867 RepID=A0AAV9JLS8_9PEZI|nr:hypothetical protein LTR36_002810 [Oleoguttula mirabilis]